MVFYICVSGLGFNKYLWLNSAHRCTRVVQFQLCHRFTFVYNLNSVGQSKGCVLYQCSRYPHHISAIYIEVHVFNNAYLK